LRDAVNAPVVDLTKASVAPTLDQIALFLEAEPNENVSLADALVAFKRDAVVPKHYFARSCDDMIAAARLVQHLPLTLEDHWMFAVAPCSAEDLQGFGSKALVTFAEAFCKRGRVSVRIVQHPFLFGENETKTKKPKPKPRAPRTQGELSVLEQAHAAYDLYLWFSLRCPAAFPEHDYAQALRKQCAAAIELGLQRTTSAKLRRDAKRLAGYVDDARLTNAAKETARLEAELALLGFGAADDPDGVYGTVTFAPGGPGVVAQAARAKKTPERAERTSREARRKKRAREDKEKTSSPGKRFSQSEKARRANARGASSATRAAGQSGSDASGSGLVFDAERRRRASPFRSRLRKERKERKSPRRSEPRRSRASRAATTPISRRRSFRGASRRRRFGGKRCSGPSRVSRGSGERGTKKSPGGRRSDRPTRGAMRTTPLSSD